MYLVLPLQDILIHVLVEVAPGLLREVKLAVPDPVVGV